jgi:hypothetical protein
MKILKLEKSNKEGKKFKAVLDNGKTIDFGSNVSQTYVEGASKQKRDNYLKRHLANSVEKHHIENLVMSPALLSAALLWNTPNLEKNISILNNKLK